MNPSGEGHWGPTARGPDVFSELRQVLKDLRALSQTVNAAASAAARPGVRHEGVDSSGAVRIIVDGRQRVQSVDIEPDWPRRVTREGLGDALMRAYGEAVCGMLAAAAEAFDEAEKDLSEASLERDVDEELRSHRRRYVPPEETLEEVQEQLRKIELLERFDYGTPAAPVPDGRDIAVYGPDRFIEITLSGGQIAGIRVLLNRLPHTATNGMIAQEALAAFRAAARAASSRSSGADDERF